MRVAIHNYYAGQEVAETGLSRRIYLAAQNLGWEAAEVASSVEINRFAPDFVLALHFRTPKITRYPTYGCMWNPPAFFARDDRFIKNILSYDAYLCSSGSIHAWLKDILYNTHKSYFAAPFFTSCNCVPYRQPDLGHPRLLYAGTGWDGIRFRELFERLDSESYMEIYGPKKAWQHAHKAYRGLLPFDGSSILDALKKAGVGLCLHRQEHCDAAVPSLRIFEIAASGAIGMCQEHPFIREIFGDAVLYLESVGDTGRTLTQISEYMRWIGENKQQALALSRRAYDIFRENYTLEKLLLGIVPHHEQLIRRKGFVSGPRASEGEKIQFIVRLGDRGAQAVSRTLNSLVSQTHPVSAIVLQCGESSELDAVLKSYKGQLSIEVINVPETRLRSTQLWSGLRAVRSEYFGLLDGGDIVYPNHATSLLQLLKSNATAGLAYSGAVRVGGPNKALKSQPASTDPAELTHFEPFDTNRFISLDNFISSNSFIARSTLINCLSEDPQLSVAEDLFLLLNFSRHSQFIFSHEVTCESYGSNGATDTAASVDGSEWANALDRIRTMFWGQQFPATQIIGASHVSDEARSLEEEIAHMKRSKFWKMRNLWFRMKAVAGLHS